MRVVLSFFFLFVISFPGIGQRMPFFTHHVTNPYLYNPAFAGYDAHPVLYLTHRQQWLGVEGAPVSSNLSFHSPTGNANPLSLGADLTHDRLGIFRSTSLRATAAYMVPLSSQTDHYVRFGLSAGIGYDGYDLTGLNTNDDMLYRAAQSLGIYVNGRFGLQYHLAGFNLGLSVPELFSQPSLSDPTSGGGISQFNRAIANINYRFILGETGQISLEPTIIYHYSTEFDHQAEALALLRIRDNFWVGGGYQQQAGIASLIGFQTKTLVFGYHYGMGGNDLASNGFGTHEIQLGLILGKKRATMRRKPRLTTKADTEAIPEAVIEAQKKQAKEERRKQKESKEVSPSRKQPFNSSSNQETTPPKSNPEAKPPLKDTTFEELESPENGSISLGESQATEPRFARTKRNKQSSHPLEMREGTYLIMGTFSQKANADKLAQELNQQGHSASVGYNTEKNYYYTHLMRSDDVDSVRSKVYQVRRETKFNKAWILIIE